MSKVKELNFTGKTIYCGLDVHKTNWKINIGMDKMELCGFSQNPDPVLLSSYFKKNYPGAQVRVVYEAGFCGFEIQRSLKALGIDCIVVNAADVPSSDKENKRKDDKRDARKLRRELSQGDLKGIYIPDIEMEQARTLVRQRHRMVQDQTRCKNRIWHMLMFSGVNRGIEKERLTQKVIKELEQASYKTIFLQMAVKAAIQEYKHIRNIIKETTLSIRKIASEPMFAQVQPYLQSIDGIGLISAMAIQTEIQDMNRFRILDSLCDYAGFVPDISSSSDRTVIKGITHRRNEFLQETIIECSLSLIHI